MKFDCIILNLFDGCVEGTNDKQAAIDFSACEDFFVVDSAKQKWMQNGKLHAIKPVAEGEGE